MKTIIFFRVAMIMIFAALIVTSCGSSKEAAVSVTDKKEMPKRLNLDAEVEVTLPCFGIDYDEEFFRVSGTGKSKDRTMAKDRAYQNALANLASKLNAVMAMGNNKAASSVYVNEDDEGFFDKMVTVSKLIAKANVSGYRTSCEKYTVSPQDNAYNCYVTIEFGKQKMVKQLHEALNNEKILKADYDFDRYLKKFEEDLKEYETKTK